jgi:SAM-dependent methyltransferase
VIISRDILERVVGVKAEDEGRIFADLPALEANPASAARRAEIFADIEDTIRERRFRVVGDEGQQAVWQKGWSEVAESLAGAEKITLETLKPQYFHRGAALRLAGEYWLPETDYFEYYFGCAVRRLLMLKAFDAPLRIVEIGCGTGINIVLAAELFPQAALVGGDWAPASSEILALMAKNLKRDIHGALHNMLTGEGFAALGVDARTDVLTVHALEQLGAAAPGVIAALIAAGPRTVLHIEPILDFYDRTDPFDDIAARYHLARNYLQGLWPALSAHAQAGRIEIIDKGRVKLGNLYHEAYSFILWRPRA